MRVQNNFSYLTVPPLLLLLSSILTCGGPELVGLRASSVRLELRDDATLSLIPQLAGTGINVCRVAASDIASLTDEIANNVRQGCSVAIEQSGNKVDMLIEQIVQSNDEQIFVKFPVGYRQKLRPGPALVTLTLTKGKSSQMKHTELLLYATPQLIAVDFMPASASAANQVLYRMEAIGTLYFGTYGASGDPAVLNTYSYNEANGKMGQVAQAAKSTQQKATFGLTSDQKCFITREERPDGTFSIGVVGAGCAHSVKNITHVGKTMRFLEPISRYFAFLESDDKLYYYNSDSAKIELFNKINIDERRIYAVTSKIAFVQKNNSPTKDLLLIMSSSHLHRRLLEHISGKPEDDIPSNTVSLSFSENRFDETRNIAAPRDIDGDGFPDLVMTNGPDIYSKSCLNADCSAIEQDIKLISLPAESALSSSISSLVIADLTTSTLALVATADQKAFVWRLCRFSSDASAPCQ